MTAGVMLAVARAEGDPAAYLDPHERAVCARPRDPHRGLQSAWARVAAKWLRLELAAGRRPRWAALDPAALARHPAARYRACPTARRPGGAPCFADGALSLSLSHSGGLAAAAVSDRPAGVDVERVERRGPSFAEEHFGESERADLLRAVAGGSSRAWLETLLWATKEAVWKTGLLPLPARLSLSDLQVQGAFDGARSGPTEGEITAAGQRFLLRRVLTAGFVLVGVVPAEPHPNPLPAMEVVPDEP
jgi:4'-phosphopantetheinyl transferase